MVMLTLIYIFIDCPKALNVLQISTEKQNFPLSLILMQVLECIDYVFDNMA